VEQRFHIMSQGTQSIDRAAQVLVHVLETEDPPTVGGLSTRLGLPKSTASRLVGALERQGLIERACSGGQLVPGAVLQRYARRATSDVELVERASEALDRLAAASGETINVGVPSLGAVELLDQRDSRHFLGSPNWVGRRVPAHGSALGKVFYAFGALPVPVGQLEPLAPQTVPSASELGLDEVRAQGYAVAVEELEPGLWAVAAPVRDASGAVVAALSVSGPTVRLGSGLLHRLGRLLVDEAVTLSTLLGYDDRKRGVA
jgi:IclR family acetate operon transcriptional repressor